jgi:hypothetical protein
MSKTVVISIREENWRDDGGDHDPFVAVITDRDYADYAMINAANGAVDNATARYLRRCQIAPTYPLTIDGVFTVSTF